MKTRTLLPTLALLILTVTLAAQQIPELNLFTGNNETTTAITDTDDSWWIGTTNGVYRIKKKSMKVNHYTTLNSILPSDLITTICAKPDGQVYIGTVNGILRYDRFAFLVINKENSRLPSDNILFLRYDAKKGIIVETDVDLQFAIK